MEVMAKRTDARIAQARQESGTGHASADGGALTGATARVSRRAADRLRAGHRWVYRSDVERLQPAAGEAEVAAGSLVTVMDARGAALGLALGTAIYSSSSEITLRMVSPEGGLSRAAYLRDVKSRVVAAVELRRELALESANDNACRLIFSEADELPGIVADRYNDIVVVQLLTQGTAQADVRQVVGETLAAELAGASGGVRLIVERPDARVRELEELALPPSEPLFVRAAEALDDSSDATRFTINGLNFGFDASAGQKTGAFLDQRLNYAAAARYARGEALDVCTYQGGFALHMAERCERVTGVDASRSALEAADRNLQLNPQLRAAVDWIEADAFELLRAFEAEGRRFDTIVLDPPAFAKSKRAVEGALRGYKDLNLRAMTMLRAGGTLVTCSCSHHVPLEEFAEVVRAAAADAGRRVQVLEMRGAAPDHPAIVTLPETSYLKCLILRVS